MYIKKFLDWIGLKERLHSKIHDAPYIFQGEIWWASLGENVGFEINGKSQLFSRPVIVFRKLTHGFYLVIPLTTKNREGSWYVRFKQRDREMSACLHQVRTIDYRRLWDKLGDLGDRDFNRVKKGFKNLYL